MELNKATIGKVKEYDKKHGVGKIISIQNIYMFTNDDVYEEIDKGDLVKFRAELVHGKPKAFFIHKYELIDDMGGKIAKSKIYKSNN